MGGMDLIEVWMVFEEALWVRKVGLVGEEGEGEGEKMWERRGTCREEVGSWEGEMSSLRCEGVGWDMCGGGGGDGFFGSGCRCWISHVVLYLVLSVKWFCWEGNWLRGWEGISWALMDLMGVDNFV